MPVLNLENIPEKIVSGLGTEELEWNTAESSEKFVLELDSYFLIEMKCKVDDTECKTLYAWNSSAKNQVHFILLFCFKGKGVLSNLKINNLSVWRSVDED